MKAQDRIESALRVDQLAKSDELRVTHHADLKQNQISVGNVRFAGTSFGKAIEWLLMPSNENGESIRLANAYCVTMANQDINYRNLLNQSGINLPDGTPVSWVMRLKSRKVRPRFERVRGPSFFVESLIASEATEHSHFFLGGSPRTLKLLIESVNLRMPKVKIAGTLSPPYAPLDETILDEWGKAIRESGASIAWIGLGSPKQDWASTYLAQQTGIHCIGVGAAFDFLAGTQPEAPKWMQNWALEWLFRLCTEPRRLWKRYLIGNIRFLFAVVLPRR